MAELPDYARPPEPVRDHITHFFYPNNKHIYDEVWPKLDDVRDRWDTLDNGDKIALLKLSYINSVFSIRTPVSSYESGIRMFMQGESIPEAIDRSGMGMALYYRPDWNKPYGSLRGKVPGIYETLSNDAFWDGVVAMIKEERYNEAQSRLMDANFIGVAKSPFTLANLGFTQKMCLDGNVSALLGGESPETEVEEYEQLCADVRDMFPELAEELEPYHLQWLLFDYQRIYQYDPEEESVTQSGAITQDVARHDTWFDAALGPIGRIRDSTHRATQEAKDAMRDDAFEEPVTVEMAREFLSVEDFEELVDRRGVEGVEVGIDPDTGRETEIEAIRRDIADAVAGATDDPGERRRIEREIESEIEQIAD